MQILEKECKKCREWRKPNEKGECDYCHEIIAPHRQGPAPGNDPAVIRKYVLEV